jgi:hypothetical protein
MTNTPTNTILVIDSTGKAGKQHFADFGRRSVAGDVLARHFRTAASISVVA